MEIDEFFKMCFHSRSNLIDFDQGGRTVKQRLFKYYPLKNHNIDAFQNGEIFFSKPHALNDSFDTSDVLIDPFGRFREIVHWNKRMASLLDSHGVFSLIESESVKNQRMWSLYSDSYNGFAVEFNPCNFTGTNYCMIHAMPVRYLDHPLDMDNPNLEITMGYKTFHVRDIANNDPMLTDRLFQCLHLVKDKHVWESENEWRMVIGNIAIEHKDCLGIKVTPNGYLLPLKSDPYKALYIGYKVPYNERCALSTIAFSRGMQVFSVTPKIINKKWDMEISQIQ